MAAFPLKIAPKHDTKICYPSIAAVTAEMGGFLFKEHHAENAEKEEAGTVLFLNERGRVTYNAFAGNASVLASRVSGRSLWTAPIIFPNAQNEK